MAAGSGKLLQKLSQFRMHRGFAMVIADKNDPVWCKPADQLVGGNACGLFHIENGACGSDRVLQERFGFAATRREE